MNSHLLPLFISYRNGGEKLIKYQANSFCVITSVILMTTLFYKALILQGEIWCWSHLSLKGLIRKLHTTLYFQARSRPFVWLLARSWTTQEYGLFCSLSTKYFNPQSTKRHIIFQGWWQKIVQRLQLLFPLLRERRMGRGIVAGDKKSCVSSPIPLFHTTLLPPPPPHSETKARDDNTQRCKKRIHK